MIDVGGTIPGQMVLEDRSKLAEQPTIEHGSQQISSKSSALVLAPKLLPGLLLMPGLYTVSGSKPFPLSNRNSETAV